MDPITHALSGAIISRTGFYQRYGRPATIILLIAALIPDIDHFSLRLAGPMAYLKYHRGFTHSIAGSFVIAAIMAAVAGRISFFREKMDFRIRFVLSLSGIYAHIFLDLITSYGTQVLFPFSSQRFSLDLVFIIDLYFSGLLLIPLIIMRFKRGLGKSLSFISIGAVIVYLGLTSVLRYSAIEQAVKRYGNSTGSYGADALPMPFSPFKWSVFTDAQNEFYQTNIDTATGKSESYVFEKRPADNEGLIKKIEGLDVVKTYLWFARYPVMTIKNNSDGILVEYYDIRFNSLPPRRPFVLRLFLDQNWNLTAADMNFHTIK